MYGMIHRGIRQMVIDAAGQAEWDAIEQTAGIGPSELISATVYDDETTIRIVSVAAQRLNRSVADCLEDFGLYWVSFTESGPYGSIMDFTGRDLVSFIANLDRMHMAVVTAMPQARVPSFSVVEAGPEGLTVHYRSERDGLEPLVRGLLRGLLQRFDIAGEVTQMASHSNAVAFRITYAEPRADACRA